MLFVLPGFFVILGLSSAYALFQETDWLTGLFFGLKAAVLAIVIEAVIRVGRRALRTRFALIVAALAFAALFFFDLPFPLVVLAAGIAGYVATRLQPAAGEKPWRRRRNRRLPTGRPSSTAAFRTSPQAGAGRSGFSPSGWLCGSHRLSLSARFSASTTSIRPSVSSSRRWPW